MKNIAALALISTIALVSCNKKETAKITKIDGQNLLDLGLMI